MQRLWMITLFLMVVAQQSRLAAAFVALSPPIVSSPFVRWTRMVSAKRAVNSFEEEEEGGVVLTGSGHWYGTSLRWIAENIREFCLPLVGKTIKYYETSETDYNPFDSDLAAPWHVDEYSPICLNTGQKNKGLAIEYDKYGGPLLYMVKSPMETVVDEEDPSQWRCARNNIDSIQAILGRPIRAVYYELGDVTVEPMYTTRALIFDLGDDCCLHVASCYDSGNQFFVTTSEDSDSQKETDDNHNGVRINCTVETHEDLVAQVDAMHQKVEAEETRRQEEQTQNELEAIKQKLASKNGDVSKLLKKEIAALLLTCYGVKINDKATKKDFLVSILKAKIVENPSFVAISP